ncbi:unnamed protein product [Arabis nemorensis]|uniref:NIF system FeS cluster assembly NifU C-terminal domain-containing protein n=1 Tax=Arabis nemorensis TaxID=586526 RepID=A0A565AWB7_9BRAS|nr:unnamed protein product [Arabis nemorensis]
MWEFHHLREELGLLSEINASNQEETASPFASVVSEGLYSAQTFDLTPQDVDLVLENVRPFLISDGGNVDVVSVEDGVVSLKIQELESITDAG